MPSFTVQNIIDRAAALADMHDGFVSPQQWIDWINVERRALAISLARAGWTSYGLSTQSWNTAPFEQKTFPFEIVAVVGVWEISPNNLYRRLKIAPYADRRQTDTQGTITGHPTEAFFEEGESGFTVRLFPRPTSGTFFLTYVNAPVDVTSVADTISYPMGLEEWIVIRLARRALIKEESDTGEMDKLLKEQDIFIHEYAWSKMVDEAPRVRNVDNVERGWDSQLTYLPPNAWLWM